MNKNIVYSNNKALKLCNVLIKKININEIGEIDKYVFKMNNYIKSKGAMPIGPLIQKTATTINNEKKLEIEVFIMRQANNFIHDVESPYSMESLIRVKNCMYVHYTGPEEKLKYAYDKINLIAFEEDIEVSDESYTIFVDKQDDNVIADIFVEKLSNE